MIIVVLVMGCGSIWGFKMKGSVSWQTLNLYHLYCGRTKVYTEDHICTRLEELLQMPYDLQTLGSVRVSSTHFRIGGGNNVIVDRAVFDRKFTVRLLLHILQHQTLYKIPCRLDK